MRGKSEIINYVRLFIFIYVGVIESFDKWVKPIAYLTPILYPVVGIRSILIKGIATHAQLLIIAQFVLNDGYSDQEPLYHFWQLKLKKNLLL